MQLQHGQQSLLELVKKAYEGEVMLPDFQRNFVWARQDVEELLKSLVESMFIGTFLIHHIDPQNPPFKTIEIEGVKTVNSNFSPNPKILILDGQQRLSSLFYALYQPNIPLKNVAYPYVFFIDIKELLNDNIEDSVFSWSVKWREYKQLINRNGEYNIDKLKELDIIPFSFLKDDFTEIWYENYKEKYTNDEGKIIRKYIDNIIKFQTLTLDVPLNEKPETIAILFERINRTGVKLSVFDLLTARLYKFLNLRKEWENSFDDNHNLQVFSSNDKRDTKVPYYIIQAIALKNGLSIKARDMLKVNEKIINEKVWSETIKTLNTDVLERLLDKNEYGIADVDKWMPYKPMITLLLALFLDDSKNIDKINCWYWASVFTERYGGSTESKLTKDYKDLLKWFKDEELIPEVVKEAREILEKTFTLEDKKYAGSSIYKGVFNLLFINSAKDFYNNDKIKFSVENLDDHHIFPKGFLQDKEVELNYDIVLNRTLISSKTNKNISKKAPANYLKEMIKIHGNKEKVMEILKDHFIDEEMVEILMLTTDNSSKEEIENSFSSFINLRQNLIKKEIEKKLYI